MILTFDVFDCATSTNTQENSSSHSITSHVMQAVSLERPAACHRVESPSLRVADSIVDAHASAAFTRFMCAR
jgi:hypothetical protein